MKIDNVALTPGLRRRLEKLQDNQDEPQLSIEEAQGGFVVKREDGSDLSSSEQTRVRGMLAAHEIDGF